MLRRFSILGCCAASALRAYSQAYDYGTDITFIARRQESSPRIVIGRLPLSSNGTILFRPEIRQMKADPYKWDLFILALSMFQYVSQDDSTSWYQIAGRLPTAECTITMRWGITARVTRYTWRPLHSLERSRTCARRKSVWLLHAQLSLVSAVASPLSGAVRG